jgi:hypothetical protein
MRMKPRLSLIALALLVAVPVLGQPRPVGTEFRVNGDTQWKLHNPVAAFNVSGAALVVWENEAGGLLGRYYGPSGALTGEFVLVANQRLATIPGHGAEVVRKDPAVAFLPTGDFLLAWTEERSNVSVDIFYEQRSVTSRDVFLQKFSAAGAPLGGPVRVNSATSGYHTLPKILVRNGGDAVVVWQTLKTSAIGCVNGRFVRSTGALGAEFKIAGGNAANPAIAGKPNGNFLVTWEADDGSSLGVFGRIFDGANGGTAFRINSDVAGLQRRAAVVADRTTGGWLVVWQAQGDTYKQAHISGQFVGALGNLVGPQFRISQGVGPAQISPSVAASKGGNFLVTWLDYNDYFPIGLFGVEIDKLGNGVGDEVEISSRQVNAHVRTSLAVSPAGDVLAPWEGFTSNDERPDIAARRVEF